VPDPADFLDQQVDCFGGAVRGPVGVVIGQDLGFPGADGVGQGEDLGDVVVGGAVEVEPEQGGPGGCRPWCFVDRLFFPAVGVTVGG
jgi:hypothetical protein